MTMFTGCFPLFSRAKDSQGFEYFSFLHSAQLIFRSEYLAYTGYKTVPGCAESGTFLYPAYINVDSGRWQHEGDKCLQVAPYAGKAFWLLPDLLFKKSIGVKQGKNMALKTTQHQIFMKIVLCHGIPTHPVLFLMTMTQLRRKGGNFQCCGVTLFQKVTAIMKKIMITAWHQTSATSN